MGLQEKQAIHDLEQKVIPRYQKHIESHGLVVALKVDWDSVPHEKEAIRRTETILGTLSNRFWDFGQNEIAKAEIAKQVQSALVRHDASLEGEYDYKVELKDGQLVFTANLLKFTLASTSSKQKSLKESIGELL